MKGRFNCNANRIDMVWGSMQVFGMESEYTSVTSLQYNIPLPVIRWHVVVGQVRYETIRQITLLHGKIYLCLSAVDSIVHAWCFNQKRT